MPLNQDARCPSPERPPSPEPPEEMTVVVAPASDHPSGLDLQGLFDFLARQSGIRFSLVRCESYEEAIASLGDGRAQIGWLGPYAYLEATRDGDIEPFAIGVPKGKATPNYHSAFVVRADSPIRHLAQVKAQRIAIGDHHSTSGYNVPKQELAGVEINLDNESEFAAIVPAHNHDEALRLLLDGSVDVTPVSSINIDENIRGGQIDAAAIRVIHRSQNIPGAPLVYLKNLAPELKSTLKTLVLEAHRHIDVGGYGGAVERYIDPAEARSKLLESYVRPQWGWRSYLTLLIFAVVTGYVVVDLEINPAALLRSASAYLADVIGRMMPPDFSDLGALLASMVETVEIAILGTLLAIALSIPIGLFSARNTAPHYLVYLVARSITIFFRAIPEFILAMVLVIAIGFGAMPGVLALGFHTMGFLAKFYAEAAEDVDVGPIEALGSMGAPRLHVVAFAVVPQVIPAFVGYNLYILDRNIRMATMLGIVGAGGIGYELQSSFRMFEYQRVSAIIIIIFATIFAIDLVSSYVRSKVQ